MAYNNNQKLKMEQAAKKQNAKRQKEMSRKGKIVEKQPERVDMPLKPPTGAPRRTPRRKVFLNNDDVSHRPKVFPQTPPAQNKNPKRHTKKWVATGRKFGANNQNDDARA